MSSFTITLWLLALAAVAGVVRQPCAPSRRLRRAAFLVLMTLAVPGLLFVLFFGMLLILQPRWN